MSEQKAAYVIGHLTIKDPEKWGEYRRRVPATLAPWGAEVMVRATLVAVLAGEHPHTDVVVIRFPDLRAANNWHSSPAYQALVPLRDQAAEMVLLTFDT